MSRYAETIKKYLHPLLEQLLDQTSEDLDFATQVGLINCSWLHFMPKKNYNHPHLLFTLGKQNPNSIRKFPETCRNNEEFWAKVLENNLKVNYFFASEDLKKDKNRLLKLIKINPGFHYCIDKALKVDVEFMHKLVVQYPLAYKAFRKRNLSK